MKPKTNIRQKVEQEEKTRLHPKASRSVLSKGRKKQEKKCPIRTDYQRDRDRIIHSKSFRRLKGKTQVFFSPAGDHFRTRLTHTLEVSQIARVIARALKLNEDLTEAIALGHDLGHTPFGHTGEEVLNRVVPGGFHHAKQSLRVVDVLEKDGQGLNLCYETRDGIAHHTKGTSPVMAENQHQLPETLEGEIVRFSDVIAYINHDFDDALRAGILNPSDVPPKIFDLLGDTHSRRTATLVTAVINATDLDRNNHIEMEKKSLEVMEELRKFLFHHVYEHPEVRKQLKKAQTMLEFMWNYFVEDLEKFSRFLHKMKKKDHTEATMQDVTDFIAGMTDVYAIELYERLFIPKRWYIL